MKTENKHLEAFSSFGRHRKHVVQPVETNNVVIYTRVSSKEQAEKNLSLRYQHKTIMEAVHRGQYKVEGTFGGTHESAKTDGRKEFQRMLDFIRQRNRRKTGRISKILVLSMDRFSRTGGAAIKLAADLREQYGVSVYAVTQPTDTANPSGVLHQNIQLLFSEYDNQLRKEKAIGGMIQKFEDGEWVVRPPMGYDIIRVNSQRSIVVNETGKKLRKAFLWKARGIKNGEIIEKLRAQGVKMYRQQLSKVFSNPFYCGVIRHGLLDGKVVKGNHEKLISEQLFMQVNELREQKPGYGAKHDRESEHLPLRVFMRCDCCDQPMTGYLVRKKRLYYYKCRTTGCRNNRSARHLHREFIRFLGQFRVRPEFIPILLRKVGEQYHERNHDKVEQERELSKRLREVTSRIDTIEEKHFVTGEMNKAAFDKFMQRYSEERQLIEHELAQVRKSMPDLNTTLKEAKSLAQHLGRLWSGCNPRTKDRLQQAIFPEGIGYNRQADVLRASRCDLAFELISTTGKALLPDKS